MATGYLCDGCGEDVAYCVCERCMTCETLIPFGRGVVLDGDGEPVCRGCREVA